MVVRWVYNCKGPVGGSFLNTKELKGPGMNRKRPINPIAKRKGYKRGDSNASD